MIKRKNTKDNSLKVLGFKYIILTFFWIIYIGFLVTVVVLIFFERVRVNNANNVNGILNNIANSDDAAQITAWYQQLMNIQYPILDFSLMSFIAFSNSNSPISDWGAAWTQRVNNMNLAYSYIFITALIAIVAFAFYFIIITKIYRRSRFEKRYGLIVKFHNDYVIYDIKIYLNFIVNLAIIFSFFNFLSTLISLAYGIILVLVSYIFWYIFRIKSEILMKRKWWKSPNFLLFAGILIIQNSFSILRVVFATEFNVNLDLILSILFPIGTITVMITLLVRNMLSTQVSGVTKAIKAINSRVSAYRIFYYSQREKSLEDYTFVSQLPVLIKGPFEKNAITAHEAFKLMWIVDEAAKFFEQHFQKPKEQRYMLYHLFNEIRDVEEIEEIKRNRLKIEVGKAKRKKQ